MKKVLSVVLLLVFVALIFCGCSSDGDGNDNGLKGVDYSKMSEEDALVRKASDKVLFEQCGFDDFSYFEIKIDKYPAKEHYKVTYEFTLYGYKTYEKYNVYIDFDGELVEFDKPFYAGRFSSFLPYFTKKALKKAEDRLDEKMKNYTKHQPYYLSVSEDGELLLRCEVISHFTNEYGKEDHNHYMFSELVCKKP